MKAWISTASGFEKKTRESLVKIGFDFTEEMDTIEDFGDPTDSISEIEINTLEDLLSIVNKIDSIVIWSAKNNKLLITIYDYHIE